MWKFIGKALAGLVLTKEARVAAVDLAEHRLKPIVKLPGPGGKEQAPADAQAQAPGSVVATPSRAELIRQALQVRAAQQTLLADLNDADRAKLVATAMKAFLNESKPKQ